jgi:hypothetical protein
MAEEIAWGKRVTPEFKAKIVAIAGRLQCDPGYLMAAMAFETGTSFSPSIRNRQSGATGLIQFMPATARALGTTTDALRAMDAVGQLDYVEKYFAPYVGKLHDIADVYMAILWPAAVGKPDSTVLFATPSAAYEQNAGLDADHDGRVTKAEASARVQAMLVQGLQPANLG